MKMKDLMIDLVDLVATIGLIALIFFVGGLFL